MSHHVGCHVAGRDRYQPRHAAQPTMDRQPSTGGLIVAVGLTITGILVIGSGIAIRNHPTELLGVAGTGYAAPDSEPATTQPFTDALATDALATDALPVVVPAAPPPRIASSTGTCVASWYTSAGPAVATVAHRSLQTGAKVRITNLANGLSTVVSISGRAPAIARRCLNLSQSAFAAIADLDAGLINVRYEALT